jgi:hypothetical protein
MNQSSPGLSPREVAVFNLRQRLLQELLGLFPDSPCTVTERHDLGDLTHLVVRTPGYLLGSPMRASLRALARGCRVPVTLSFEDRAEDKTAEPEAQPTTFTLRLEQPPRLDVVVVSDRCAVLPHWQLLDGDERHDLMTHQDVPFCVSAATAAAIPALAPVGSGGGSRYVLVLGGSSGRLGGQLHLWRAVLLRVGSEVWMGRVVPLAATEERTPESSRPRLFDLAIQDPLVPIAASLPGGRRAREGDLVRLLDRRRGESGACRLALVRANDGRSLELDLLAWQPAVPE